MAEVVSAGVSHICDNSTVSVKCFSKTAFLKFKNCFSY